MFNRIGGVGDEVYKEGLHFRVPWFQYPIVYDIRARPNQIRSPTGSKDLQVRAWCVKLLAELCSKLALCENVSKVFYFAEFTVIQ